MYVVINAAETAWPLGGSSLLPSASAALLQAAADHQRKHPVAYATHP